MNELPPVSMRLVKPFEDLFKAWMGGKRRFLMEGGTSSSKTWSVLQFIILLAMQVKSPIMISVVSESLPHLKRGCIRDFFRILDESPDNNPYWSKTEFTYKRRSWQGTIEFFGADDASKVRGPRRDVLFINEGNNIPWETARGLDMRTMLFTVVDWNPVSEFWAHEYWKDKGENEYGHYTYLDVKEVLSPPVIATIESLKDTDPNGWSIYGLGLLGKIEGLVYPQAITPDRQVDELPDGDVFYGLDYGFAADPTVLVKSVIIGDRLYSQEMFYDDSGLTNDDIAKKLSLLKVGSSPIYPDPDEPKSLEELRRKGFNVRESVKGKGSVAFGIQKVNQLYQYWTKDSLNCIKEQRNFRFIKDRQTGEYTDRTTHQWSHGLDARRYGVATYQPAYRGLVRAASNH